MMSKTNWTVYSLLILWVFLTLKPSRLDILVNNAGLGDATNEKTENGFLKVMQTNYFGPFLLTNLLLGTIPKSQ